MENTRGSFSGGNESCRMEYTAGAYADVPLFLFHLLEFLDVDYEVDVDDINRRWAQASSIDVWSQIILKDIGDEVEQLTNTPKTGIWRMGDQGRLEFARWGHDWHSLHDESEAFFLRVLAPGDRRLWLLRSVALRIERQANPLWRFEIYYRRLLIALAALAVAGWLAAVSALYFWLDRQPHNQVGWFDLAAPWRWPGLRAKRGDTAVLAPWTSSRRGISPRPTTICGSGLIALRRMSRAA